MIGRSEKNRYPACLIDRPWQASALRGLADLACGCACAQSASKPSRADPLQSLCTFCFRLWSVRHHAPVQPAWAVLELEQRPAPQATLSSGLMRFVPKRADLRDPGRGRNPPAGKICKAVHIARKATRQTAVGCHFHGFLPFARPTKAIRAATVTLTGDEQVQVLTA